MSNETRIHDRRRGLCWGRLVANLDAAAELLEKAKSVGLGILPEAFVKQLDSLQQEVRDLEMAAWRAEAEEAANKKKR